MLGEKIKQAKELYEKYERQVSAVSLLFGFVIDSLTLQNIDALWENLWIVVNLFLVAFIIILLNRKAEPIEEGTWKHFWLFNTLQFSFGALLGSFFIFYFRSATLATAWPFLLIILVSMIANEIVQKKYAVLAVQISFLYLSLFSFSIFLLPLVIHNIGPMIFIASGFLSLFAVWLYSLVLKRFARERFKSSRTLIKKSVLAIFILFNVLYFTGLIPPIPLALKDAGIFHSVSRNQDGDYVVSREERGFLDYFRLREKVSWTSGDSLYAYSAIFSPAKFDVEIAHEWQYKDEELGWQTATKIPLFLVGGRGDGFRTYSTKSNLFPGLWRVNVVTPRGSLIGRITFRVVSIDDPLNLEDSIKD